MTPEEKAAQVKTLSTQLLAEGRTDLLLKAISVPVLEQLRIEAARATLSPLVITEDYRFLLPDYGNREVQLSPIHKALYLLFLNHPEGIEFKNLVDHREELFALYRKIGNRIDPDKITETVNRLTNPLDNAINEKCSRIKAAFSDLMDEYQADYYIINSHVKRHQGSSMKLWFERLKIINLPRELVISQYEYFRYLLSHAPQLEQPLHVILLPQVLQCALNNACGLIISLPNRLPSGRWSL